MAAWKRTRSNVRIFLPSPILFLHLLTPLSITDSLRGKEGYDPAKVSLFGADEKPANSGQPGNRGREGYDPAKVTLFGADEKPANNGQPGM